MVSLMNNMQPQPAVQATVKSEPGTLTATQPSKNILAYLYTWRYFVDITNDDTPTSNDMEFVCYISERVAIGDPLFW